MFLMMHQSPLLPLGYLQIQTKLRDQLAQHSTLLGCDACQVLYWFGGRGVLVTGDLLSNHV